MKIIEALNKFSFLLASKLIKYCKNKALLFVRFKREIAYLHMFLYFSINLSKFIFIVKFWNFLSKILGINYEQIQVDHLGPESLGTLTAYELESKSSKSIAASSF